MAKTVDRIKRFNQPLLAEKVQWKYKRMAENIFGFYRGTCHLFFEDLAKKVKKLPRSPLAWISGDLHIENFGSYKAANGLVYFDLNDFDEALLAPAAFEVLRMITSIFIAFYALKIQRKQAINMARLFIRTYAATLEKGKAQYIEPQTAKGIICTFLEAVSKRDQQQLIEKRTMIYKGKLRLLVDNEKHFAIDKELKKQLIAHMKDWIRTSDDGPYYYKVKDVVFRLAGTGSIGVQRYLFLLQNKRQKNDYLLLDMKEARPSSLLPYLACKQPKWHHEAQRVVAIADRMQSRLPSQFSHTTFNGVAFVLEEMQPTSDKVNFELIKDRYRDVYQVINDMAILTASSQLRSSGREGSANADALIRFGKQYQQWEESILQYALAYTQIVKAQYKEFKAAYKNGL